MYNVTFQETINNVSYTLATGPLGQTNGTNIVEAPGAPQEESEKAKLRLTITYSLFFSLNWKRKFFPNKSHFVHDFLLE